MVFKRERAEKGGKDRSLLTILRFALCMMDLDICRTRNFKEEKFVVMELISLLVSRGMTSAVTLGCAKTCVQTKN